VKVKDLLDPTVREQAKIDRRLKRLTSSAILDWADIAADGIARHLSAWRRNEDRFDLDEAATNARVLSSALTLLQQRNLQ
jgi:hypothetical protein